MKQYGGGVAVSWTSGVFNTVKNPDQIFKVLYTVGYRLTGNHRLTVELIGASISELNRQNPHAQNPPFKDVGQLLSGSNHIVFAAILKTLCFTYVNKFTVMYGRNHATAHAAIYELSRNGSQIQEALLYLQPKERLLVVLRDILGLNYAEIADLTGLEKNDVVCLLSAGRWSLRKLLTAPVVASNLPKRAGAAK